MSISIEPARPTDLPALLTLLECNGLPLDGFSDHLDHTLVARVDDSVVGSAALEMYGASALLRSVAVDAHLRGQGWGQRLTQAALDLAQHRGVQQVYLLTETAGDFFPRFGFQRITRMEIDPAVKQSVEFTSACPDSALVMVRSLQVRDRGLR